MDIKYLAILLMIIRINSESSQKFVYTSKSVVTVESSSFVELSASLATQANQYLSEATLSITMNINQNTNLNYNIIYFNFQNSEGQACYQNWIVNNTVMPLSMCCALTYSSFSAVSACMNYTNCLNQNIFFIIPLQEDLYKQEVIIIQNINNSSQLILNTQMTMQLSSRNTWFYWGVGLTCLLIISLVLYAGIIFYWMLKYKKTKKIFEQFKLTESETIKKDA